MGGRPRAAAGHVVADCGAPGTARGLRGALSLQPRPSADRSAVVDQLFERFGRGALLPFQRRSDKHWFVFRDEALIAYGRRGRVAVVLGDPIGPPGAAWSALLAFLGACHRRGLTAVVYQATDAWREPYESAGLRCFRVGSEAIVDLATFDLVGARRANLRHTITRASRGGVLAKWYAAGLGEERVRRLGAALTAIDTEWRRRAGPEMGFTIGRLDPAALAATPIAVAFDDSGTPTAFATFASSGCDGGWVLDLMRRTESGVPGALEACVAAAAASMRERGATTLSLGLVPLAGLDRGSLVLEERLLARGVDLVRPVYDVAGLEFFKNKFDPRWDTRYAALGRGRDLPALVLGLLALHLLPPGRSIGQVIVEAVRAAIPRPAGRWNGAP